MTALWILPFVILLIFAMLLLGPILEAAPGAVRKVDMRCPVMGERLSVDFVERSAFGIIAPVDVLACSHVRNTGELSCGKACLGQVPLARTQGGGR